VIEGRDSHCTCARCGAALPIADLNAFTIAMRSHSGTIVRTVRERGRDIHQCTIRDRPGPSSDAA
jgi:hypothetical protein